jgi:CDP-paratose 2-epimerase
LSVAVITGSAGLIGSEAVAYFAGKGLDVVGIDNDMRAQFFGPEASTAWMKERLLREVPVYKHHDTDVRDEVGIDRIFAPIGTDIRLVIHAAAQPSHDWAAREPQTDFTVNANGTLVLLEATRKHAPDAVFIFTSTNKVYGDRPNQLPFVETDSRWELPAGHPYYQGIPEEMPIDSSLHSLFGASKVAADVLVQEYGRYFGMRTACFRGGCLTGPNHSGAQLHGFLAYLLKCAVTRTPYTVFGYKGKQVRDNIHSADLIRAFDHVFERPRAGEVYNIGGGRHSHCSMFEAIHLSEELTGETITWRYEENARKGDHIWWISHLARFQSHYPEWKLDYDVPRILREIFDANRERWMQPARKSR